MMNTTGGAPNQSSHTSIGTRTNSDENNTAFAIPPQSNNARLLQQQPQPSGRNYLPLAAPPVTTAASVPLLTQAASSMANTLNASTINQQSHTPALHSPDSMALQQQQLTSEQVLALLSKCNWIDKTVWASRQLLGGQSVNGFLKATATVQRIKKQRARQSAKTAHTSRKAGEAESTGSLEEQQAEEEVLKKEIMNARTAKKIKTELDGGIQFCALLHDTIRNILLQMDPSIPRIEPLNSRSGPSTTVTRQLSGFKQGALNAAMTAAPSCSLPPPTPLSQRQTTSPSSMTSPSSAGNSSGSTLRRYRKTKLPPSSEPLLEIPEFDDLTGKRVCTKKEHTLRVSEMLRFRVLRRGDPVAARVSSRDLWILARVVKDYPGTNMTSADFLRLSETRREQVFKDKVLIQDVEEHDGGAAAAVLVSRVLVLPLPRNVSEAAEWGTHYRFFKKGSRVYAMYPQTTSLYTATVVDCATYCRGDEDIIVVEFDGDEPDAATGRIPACHIPARFVTLIPREFLCAPTVATGSGSTSGKKRRSSPDNDSANPDPMSELLDDMAFDGDLPGLDNFDDLDFDLLGDS